MDNNDQTEQANGKARPIALSGIIISMMLMAGASGLGFAYVPIRLNALGFEAWVASAMFPALALGGLAGCLVTGWMLRVSGHARVFVTFYALIILSFLALLVTDNPAAWIVARGAYGFGINGAFIVAQSWLHDATTDATRGRVITTFYVCYVVTLGLGSFMIGYLDISGPVPMSLAVALVTLAIIPVGMTRLRQPVPPEEVNIEIRKVWQISPVGLAGMLCVGGLTMTLQGFAPIYTGKLGYEPRDIGLLMLMMQMGLLVIQLPMGALSDRIDRRYVLIIVAAMSATMAVIMIVTQSSLSFLWLILLFAVWSGSIETIYSVSSALANDRADPKQYVYLSSTQMVAWSAGGFIVPMFSTVMLGFLPLEMFMWIVLTISCAFVGFVIYRIGARGAVKPKEMEAFQATTAQVVHTGEFYNPEAIEERNAGVSEGLS